VAPCGVVLFRKRRAKMMWGVCTVNLVGSGGEKRGWRKFKGCPGGGFTGGCGGLKEAGEIRLPRGVRGFGGGVLFQSNLIFTFHSVDSVV